VRSIWETEQEIHTVLSHVTEGVEAKNIILLPDGTGDKSQLVQDQIFARAEYA